MKCLDEKCNSNGIWPFVFNVSVEKISEGLEVSVTIHRGWTPSHGGGKALNQEMQYDITIPIKVIYFKDEYASSQK